MISDEYPDEYSIPPWLGFDRTKQVSLTLGTPTTGLWCETCLLPSRYEVPLYVLGDDGPFQTGVFDRCDGCRA